MARGIAHESEHRRGLVLGLTLAEVLILLLFLLLLAFGVRLTQLSHAAAAADALAPLVLELQNRNVSGIDNIQALADRLARVGELEKSNIELRRENTDLALLRALGPKAPEIVRSLETIVRRAERIRPDDPPVLLTRLDQIIEVVGFDADPEILKQLSELAARAKELERTNVVLIEDRDRFRRERDSLMRGGGRGLMYPNCWTNDRNETEFIFDVTIQDSGLVVQNVPSARKTDDTWKLVDDFPRGVEISESRFRRATSRLFAWSKEHECRFIVIMRDGTGPASKPQYKVMRAAVEQNFYVKPVDGASPSRRQAGSRQTPLRESLGPDQGSSQPMLLGPTAH